MHSNLILAGQYIVSFNTYQDTNLLFNTDTQNVHRPYAENISQPTGMTLQKTVRMPSFFRALASY